MVSTLCAACASPAKISPWPLRNRALAAEALSLLQEDGVTRVARGELRARLGGQGHLLAADVKSALGGRDACTSVAELEVSKRSVQMPRWRKSMSDEGEKPGVGSASAHGSKGYNEAPSS